MHPVSPVVPTADGDETIYAECQDQYVSLPAIKSAEGSVLPLGTILTRWILSEEEKQIILEQGYVYAAVMTFNRGLQPILLSASVPDGFALRPLEEWPEEINA